MNLKLHLSMVILFAMIQSVFAFELVNPGFEIVADNGEVPGWELPPNGTWKVEANSGVNGMNALSWDSSRHNGGKDGIPGQWIEIDRSKRYRFECWVRTENLEGPSNPGASIGIECVDKDGKVFYGKYSYCSIGGTQKEWVKIDDLTGENQFPPRAVKLRLEVFIRNGTGATGKAWFDNFLLEPYDESKEMVPGLYSSAYRNTAEEGEVEFHAPLHLPSNRVYNASFSFKNVSGQMCKVPAQVLDCGQAKLKIQVNDLALGKQEVELVVREKDKVLGEAKCSFERVNKLPQRKVYIDKYNRTIVDGKPFFPLGMYIPHLEEGWIEPYSKGPFNTVLVYWYPKRAGLDLCKKYNLMLIGSLYKAYMGVRTSWAKTKEKELALVNNVVSDCKDHPNLLAWYTNDEYSAMMIPRLRERRDLLEKLDPDHPVCGCVCQVDEMSDYLGTFDVVSSDPYPIGYPHRTMTVDMAADWTRKTREGVFNGKAMWQTPQAFSWHDYSKKGETIHNGFPTEDEFFNMSCQCIAEGANGLIYYSYGQLRRTYKEPKEYEDVFGRVTRSCAKIKANEDIFLSVDPSPRAFITTPNDGTASVRTWCKDGVLWVLAVNASHKVQKLEIKLDQTFKMHEVTKVAFGIKPIVSNNQLTFDFPALGCSLVGISATK